MSRSNQQGSSAEISSQQIVFPSIPALPTLASCSVDGAGVTLDWLLAWQADVQIGEQVIAGRPVFEVLRDVQRDPMAFGVSAAAAAQAVQRFTAQAGPALEAEGGDVGWITREFERQV